MAAATYTRAILGRILLPSPAAHPIITTRAFSSAIPLRINPWRSPYGNTDALSQTTRLNPLVGANPLPEPAGPPAEESHPTPAPEASSSSSSSSPPPSPPYQRKSTHDTSADTQIIPPSPPPPPPPPPASSGADAEAPSPRTTPSYAYDAVANTLPPIDIANIISEKSATYSHLKGISDPTTRPNVRTKAVIGRTVFIKGRLTPRSGPTVTVALRVLDKMCRDQKIKNKYHSQKFHERTGLKKKRLRSQRWRSRFRTGFKAAVDRVLELKRQGW